MALVYPNTYYIGMSNLGFQAIYGLLNRMDHVVCERAFLPDKDNENCRDICTVESNRSIRHFDIIAFSISFENDYINVLSIMKKTGLPLLSNARGESYPLFIAGGVTCFLNPEPIAPFFDCIFVGEAEPVLPEFITHFDLRQDRDQALIHAANTWEGIYVPRFYQVAYHTDNTIQSTSPLADVPPKVKRVYAAPLSDFTTASTILTSHTTFNDTYLMETGRGCPHGCRFCSAGYIYRPPRTRSLATLTPLLDKGGALTQKIGLVSAAVSDHPDLSSLCLLGGDKGLTLSFSSLRAEALTHELATEMGRSGVKTATIAPDAGSEKMRRIINKGITEEQILNAADILVSAGIPNLKLYFMIGLPRETEEDVAAISHLVKQIKQVFLESSRKQKRIGTIHVSINAFVPKPVTPFQWVPMDTLKVLKNKIKHIQKELKGVPNVTVRAESPQNAIAQAFLARGDRTISEILRHIAQTSGEWSKYITKQKELLTRVVFRQRDQHEVFPWDIIDHTINKSYLYKEYLRALDARETEPCNPTACVKCGVCLPPVTK